MKFYKFIGFFLLLLTLNFLTEASPIMKLNPADDPDLLKNNEIDLLLKDYFFRNVISHPQFSNSLTSNEIPTKDSASHLTNKLSKFFSFDGSQDNHTVREESEDLSNAETTGLDAFSEVSLDPSRIASGQTLMFNSEVNKRSPEGELLKKLRELQRKSKSRQLNNDIMMAVYQQLLNV